MEGEHLSVVAAVVLTLPVCARLRCVLPSAQNPMALMFHVGMKGGVPEDPAAMSEEGKEVLRGCLQHDINSRKSAAELLNLPY